MVNTEINLHKNLVNNVSETLLELENYCKEIREDMANNLEESDAYVMDVIYNLPRFTKNIETDLNKFYNEMDKIVFG